MAGGSAQAGPAQPPSAAAPSESTTRSRAGQRPLCRFREGLAGAMFNPLSRAGGLFRNDATGQNKREQRVHSFLGNVLESRILEEASQVMGFAVMDGASLEASDDEIVHDASHEVVGPPVQQKQSSARSEDAEHFANGYLLVRIMVERVGAGDDVEGVVGEGNGVAVGDGESEAGGVAVEFGLGAMEHRFAEVEADGLPSDAGEAAGEFSGAATDVEQAAARHLSKFL